MAIIDEPAIVALGGNKEVMIQHVFQSDWEGTPGKGINTTGEFLLRCFIAGTKTRTEMRDYEAYAIFQHYILNNIGTLLYETSEGNFILPATKIHVAMDKSNYPAYKGTATWEFNVRKPNYITQPTVWSHSLSGGSSSMFIPISQRFLPREGFQEIQYAGINWDKEKQDFNGTEVYSPEWKMVAKQQKLSYLVDNQYLAMLSSMSKTVNLTNFRGFMPGCVLYLGADLEESYNNENRVFDITHQFIVAPYLTNFTIEDITVPYKAGHEYLWTTVGHYQNTEGKNRTRVDQVNIAKMYNESNFDLLGLNT